MAAKKNPRNYGDFRDNISDKDFTRLKDLQDEHKEIQGRIDRAASVKDESHPDYMTPENVNLAKSRQSQITARRASIIQPYKEGKAPKRTDSEPETDNGGYKGNNWDADLKAVVNHIHENSSYVDPKTKKRMKGVYDPETGKAASKQVLEGRATGHLMGVNRIPTLKEGSAEPLEGSAVPRGLQVSPEVREKNNSGGKGGASTVTESNEPKTAPVSVREEARKTIHKVVEKPEVPHESVAEISARRQATPVAAKRTPTEEEASDHAARMSEYRESAKSNPKLTPPPSPYEEGYKRPDDFGAPVVRRDQRIADQKKREKEARAAQQGRPVSDTSHTYNAEKAAEPQRSTSRRTASAQASSTQFGDSTKKPSASLTDQLKSKLGGTSGDSDLSALAAQQNGSAPVTQKSSRSIGTSKNPSPNSLEGRAAAKPKPVQSPSEDAPDSAGRIPALQKQLPSKALIGMPSSRQLNVTNPHFGKKEDQKPEPAKAPSPVQASPQFSTTESSDGGMFSAEPYRRLGPENTTEPAASPAAKRSTRQGVLFDTKGKPNPRAAATASTGPAKAAPKTSAPAKTRFSAPESSEGGLFPSEQFRRLGPENNPSPAAGSPAPLDRRQGVLFDKKGKPNPRATATSAATKAPSRAKAATQAAASQTVAAKPDFSGLPDSSQHEGGLFPSEGLRRMGPENNTETANTAAPSRNPRQGVLFDTKGNPNPRAMTSSPSPSSPSPESAGSPEASRQPRHFSAPESNVPHAAASSAQLGGTTVHNHYYGNVNQGSGTQINGSVGGHVMTDNASIGGTPGGYGSAGGSGSGNHGSVSKNVTIGHPTAGQKLGYQLLHTKVGGKSLADKIERYTGGGHAGFEDSEGNPIGKTSDKFVQNHPVNGGPKPLFSTGDGEQKRSAAVNQQAESQKRDQFAQARASRQNVNPSAS